MSREESWLEVMPRLPLVRGVPLRERLPNGDWVRCVCLGTTVWTFLREEWDASLLGPLRVDLEENQGMAFALRLLAPRYALIDPLGEWWDVMDRHLEGETTDADRLLVARTIRTIQEG